jgi:hypothetical protein
LHLSDVGGQSLPPGAPREIAAACVKNALRARIDLTGVGSCMYVKRACLDDIEV